MQRFIAFHSLASWVSDLCRKSPYNAPMILTIQPAAFSLKTYQRSNVARES
jgi:hypothetical protein